MIAINIQTKLCRSENRGSKRTKKVEYIVVHYTANYGDTAKNNADYFAREIVGASAHYFVDEIEIWCSVPEDTIAWHCGAKQYYHPACRNANSIGVEICMLDKKGAVRQKSIDHAIDLVRELMDKYGIDVDHVVRHYDVTHKQCPEPMVANPALWADFKQRLEDEDMNIEKFSELMAEYDTELRKKPGSNWSNEARTWAVENGLVVGGSDNEMMWRANMSREELITVLWRYSKLIGKA